MSDAGVELRAAYRLQLTTEFGFAAARSLVPYLRDLGVSHLYLSPSLQARPGSTHGYDVIDPSRLSDTLGGAAEFQRLAGAARDAGMGLILDVVPNHMAADEANRYWADPVLRQRFFDVDPVTRRHRRFFDIDDLAGVRQEDPEVFEETHRLVLAMVGHGLVDGLRIDHPDGLADPAGYLARLRERGPSRVWVEKILDPGERLRAWPVCGTVGYEFLNDVCALFVDPAGEAPLTALWEQISGDRRGFGEVAHEAKLEQARGTFAPELERLARAADGRFGIEEIARAVSSLPVYRTYVDPGRAAVEDQDRAVLEAAALSPELRRLLTLDEPGPAEFVTRFQQTTPAIMAKGVEDTAFYRYCRLLALNDVGGDPSRFGITVARFHEGCLERARRFPLNLLTTQTHDAKRSGDVRMRIGALASIAPDWARHVEHWFELTEGLRAGGAPDDVERYFIFQTLTGAWPVESQRIESYMEKALREAKRNTQLDRARRRVGGGSQALLPVAVLPSPVPGRLRAVRGAGLGDRRSRRPGPTGAEADRARDPRHLSGRRASVPGARRSRQPPARGLGLAPGDAAAADGRLAAGRRDAEAVRHAAAARAPRPPPRGADRRPLRAARRRRRCVRVRPRRRGAGGGRPARPRPGGDARAARRSVARRAARRAAVV